MPRKHPESPSKAGEDLTEIRLDLWLWTARFFKTRSLAAQAIDGGRVSVNDQPAKRSRQVRVGDRIDLRIGPYKYCLEVIGLMPRRGSASLAQALYREDPATLAARLELSQRLKTEAPIFHEGSGRPTKKQRRAIDSWKGRR